MLFGRDLLDLRRVAFLDARQFGAVLVGFVVLAFLIKRQEAVEQTSPYRWRGE